MYLIVYINLSLAHATFARGAKLDWHIHPAGQYLLIIEGTGYYQERRKPIQIVHKGDVIKCLPGVEHWHGATQNQFRIYEGYTCAKREDKMVAKGNDEEYNQVNYSTMTAKMQNRNH
jgi:quercetin dioxygenase-like cupin family protein